MRLRFWLIGVLVVFQEVPLFFAKFLSRNRKNPFHNCGELLFLKLLLEHKRKMFHLWFSLWFSSWLELNVMPADTFTELQLFAARRFTNVQMSAIIQILLQ